ncbi:hypothetical protein AAZX31_15G208300 [Glycine max]|nr:hypothetical protein JHK87_043169 [Glycine soja]
MNDISSVLFILFVLFIGIENEGPLKVIEAKICDIKLYNYCDQSCFTDCFRKYGKKVLPLCNEWGQCICRYRC